MSRYQQASVSLVLLAGAVLCQDEQPSHIMECGNTARTCCCPDIPNSCKISDCNNFVKRPLPQYCDCSDLDKMQMCGSCIGECPALSHVEPLPYDPELKMCAPGIGAATGTSVSVSSLLIAL